MAACWGFERYRVMDFAGEMTGGKARGESITLLREGGGYWVSRVVWCRGCCGCDWGCVGEFVLGGSRSLSLTRKETSLEEAPGTSFRGRRYFL